MMKHVFLSTKLTASCFTSCPSPCSSTSSSCSGDGLALMSVCTDWAKESPWVALGDDIRLLLPLPRKVFLRCSVVAFTTFFLYSSNIATTMPLMRFLVLSCLLSQAAYTRFTAWRNSTLSSFSIMLAFSWDSSATTRKAACTITPVTRLRMPSPATSVNIVRTGSAQLCSLATSSMRWPQLLYVAMRARVSMASPTWPQYIWTAGSLESRPMRSTMAMATI
mmetsp:Transcript_93968/g.270733  ORF Transcript_93968/g.270733 Transcript_93968/m.270733 type:complete len:221 (+) Transcript_93968:1706-2368(+)